MHEKAPEHSGNLSKSTIMRRIELIAPFSAARGNLSGKQTLLYPTKNNAAWESPSNKRNYATNYTARYIGAVRSRDGRSYFSVKKRSAITMSPAMRLQQALIGGSKVVSDFIMHDGAHIQGLEVLYRRSQIYRDGGSFYKWVSAAVRLALRDKSSGIYFFGDGSQSGIIYQNPWISSVAPGSPVAVTIPADILAKFWMQLANSPVEFTVNGSLGVAHTGNFFEDLVGTSYNVLGITIDNGEAKIGELFINFDHDGTKYVANSDNTEIQNYPTLSFYLSETAGAEWPAE